MWSETTYLCFKKYLIVKKKFSNSLYFYWNLGKHSHFYVPTTNDKYNLSYSRTQDWRIWQLRRWLLCFMWSSFFAIWRVHKQLFHIAPFRCTIYVLNWRKWQLRRWLLWFRWYSFFAFWRAHKQLFHIAPFSSTCYVLNWRRLQLRRWLLCLRWCSFFAFLRAHKQLCHIALFGSTSYVLNSFWCLDFSNRVSNWNKGKAHILEGSIFQIYQLEKPVFIYILMFHISFWISV